MDTIERDKLVEAATQAKITLETYTNPGIISRATGGEAMRLHDFINADIPLMIAAAKGKLGTTEYPAYDLKDERMNARLDMDPLSLKQRVEQGFEAAKYSMNWIGPQLPPAAAHFFKSGPEGGFEQLRDNLIAQRQEIHDRENNVQVGYERGGKKISSENLNSEIVNYTQELAGKADQFVRLKDGERVRVDVMIFEFSEHSQNAWTNRYAVTNAEGKAQMVNESEIDRGTPAYGVLIERNDKTYFVPMGNQLDGKADGEAREVIGIESGLRKYFEREVGRDNAEYTDGEQIMRAVTNRDIQGYQQASSGEVHYVNANKQHDNRGPIVLTAVPWTTTPDMKERLEAERMVDIQEYRTGNMIQRAVVTNDVETPAVTRADPNRLAAQLAAAQAQGMAI